MIINKTAAWKMLLKPNNRNTSTPSINREAKTPRRLLAKIKVNRKKIGHAKSGKKRIGALSVDPNIVNFTSGSTSTIKRNSGNKLSKNRYK